MNSLSRAYVLMTWFHIFLKHFFRIFSHFIAFCWKQNATCPPHRIQIPRPLNHILRGEGRCRTSYIHPAVGFTGYGIAGICILFALCNLRESDSWDLHTSGRWVCARAAASDRDPWKSLEDGVGSVPWRPLVGSAPQHPLLEEFLRNPQNWLQIHGVCKLSRLYNRNKP